MCGMKFLRNKKIGLTSLIAIVAIIIVLSPKEAHAFFGIDYILSGAIGFATYVLNAIIGFIAGIGFAIGAYLVQWALGFNDLILGNKAVEVGWSIVLNFANLGFVLAIIIIAFATIFRLENYAIKQTLWKLIVAALLVNFSLVISGAFIDVANITAKYFQDASKLNPFTAANTLGAVFNNQRLMSAGNETCFWYQKDMVVGIIKNTNGMCSKEKEEGTLSPDGKFRCDCSSEAVKTGIKKANSGYETLGTDFLTMIASLFFSVVFSVLSIITLFATFIMLLIRYVALGFILVLSPLAWLCWVLPSTQHLWKKWWDNFLRWTFFAPAMSFFMYLAIKSIEGMPIIGDKKINVKKALDGTLVQPGFLENVGSMLILIGFMLGGLYVANSLSIMGASTAMNMAKGVGKGVGAWAGRKTWGGIKDYTRQGYNWMGEKRGWKDKSTDAAFKAGEEGRGMIGRMWYGLKARTYANLSAPADREKERYKTDVSKLTMAQAMAQLQTTTLSGKKAALMEYMTKNRDKIPRGKITKETKMIEEPEMEDVYESKVSKDSEGNLITEKIKTGQRPTGKTISVPKEVETDEGMAWKNKYLGGTQNKSFYERLGGDYDGDIVKKVLGMPAEASDAYNNKDWPKFTLAMDKFTSILKKSDMTSVAKIWGKDIFKSPYGDKLVMAKIIANSIGKNNSKIVASLLPHMDGKAVNNFNNIYKTELKNDPKLEKVLKNFEKISAAFETSEGWSPTSSEPSPAPRTS